MLKINIPQLDALTVQQREEAVSTAKTRMFNAHRGKVVALWLISLVAPFLVWVIAFSDYLAADTAHKILAMFILATLIGISIGIHEYIKTRMLETFLRKQFAHEET